LAWLQNHRQLQQQLRSQQLLNHLRRRKLHQQLKQDKPQPPSALAVVAGCGFCLARSEWQLRINRLANKISSEGDMPEVYTKDGKMVKKFAYTKAGMAAARRYAKDIGGKVEIDDKMEMAAKFKRKRSKM